MKKSLIWLIVLNLCVGLCCAEEKGMSASPREIDFGVINAFQVVERTVILRNDGSEVYKIRKIKADCSCFKAWVESTSIGSGETTTLSLRIFSRTAGHISRTVLILPETNSKQEYLDIKIKGEIIEPVSAHIGWKYRDMLRWNPLSQTALGVVDRSKATLVIQLDVNREKGKWSFS